MGRRQTPPSVCCPSSVCTCPPNLDMPQLYLIAAHWLLSHLQAGTHVDETNFGSSLGRKPVPLHQVRDHHMVFQAGTKCSYLKGRVHSLSLLGRFYRHSGARSDPENLVTSADQLGKHNFLCLMQVLSTAGGVWEQPQGRSVSSNFSWSKILAIGAHDVVVETPRVTFKCHEKTSFQLQPGQLQPPAWALRSCCLL